MKLTSIFEELSKGNLQEGLNLLVNTLVDTISKFLNLDLIISRFSFHLVNLTVPKYNLDFIFDYGVERSINDNKLEIKIHENQKEFFPFILLREIFNLFIPTQVRDYDWIQLTINQMILSDLYSNKKTKDWNSLVRENVKLTDDISIGFSVLEDYDRCAQYFKNPALKRTSYRLFFNYVRGDPDHLPKKMDYIHVFFGDNINLEPEYFTDELIETLRCLTKIFYKIKTYRGITEYHKLFRQYKREGSLKTGLTSQKFEQNMELIKNKTVIAPNYIINFHPLKCSLFACALQFNPVLSKSKVLKVIAKWPFMWSPRFYYNGFGVEVHCFFKIPNSYISDLSSFLESLKGSIIESFTLLEYSKKYDYRVNCNYYREVFQNSTIPNPNNSVYKKKFEINMERIFDDKTSNYRPTLLDFILFDRFDTTSNAGLGFERKDEILRTIKKDIMESVSFQRGKIKQLRETLDFFHSTEDMKDRILQFMKNNEKYGFFYIKYFLTDLVDFIDILNKEREGTYQIQESISNKQIANNLKENLLLNNKKLTRTVLKDILPFLSKSRANYLRVVKQFEKFRDLFDCCYNLKLFDLNNIKRLLEDKNILTTLYSKKDEKLAQIQSKYKTYKITNQLLDERIEYFLNYDPPIIVPSLINTIKIHNFWLGYQRRFELILENSQENLKTIERLKSTLEVNSIYRLNLLNENKKSMIFHRCLTPPMSNQQIMLFWSMMNTQFSIKRGKRYIGQGQDYATTLRNFFDTETRQFFYTSNLFEHLLKYMKALFGDVPAPIKNQKPIHSLNLFPNKLTPTEYITKINAIREKPDYNLTDLTNLLHFHSQLKKNLSHSEQYQHAKNKDFFKKYIKKIKFKPSFGSFGLSQFYLFIDCPDLNNVDFKLLFLNTFQSLKFPMCINSTIPFIIKYIMPYDSLNTRYLNWLTKSKKNVRSFCFFSVQKEYRIFHLDKNLTSKGWGYDKDDFKIFAEKILFKEDYSPQLPKAIELNFQKPLNDKTFSPDSPEYQALVKVYSTKSIDIKSYLGTKKKSTIDALLSLLDKNLIFPYIAFKNLGFLEKIQIIIPGTTSSIQRKLLKIFTFFNLCTMAEVKGQYYIQGFDNVKRFESGILIKINFPKTHVGFFFDVVINLFEYLEIKHYIILHDLADGIHIIDSTFESIESFKSYNPLKNLIWDKTDKTWKNHKIYNENHDPIYPDLFFSQNSE